MNLPYTRYPDSARPRPPPPREIHAPQPPQPMETNRGIEASVSVFVTMLEAKVPAPIYLLNVTGSKIYGSRDVRSCQLWFFLKLGEMQKKKNMTT